MEKERAHILEDSVNWGDYSIYPCGTSKRALFHLHQIDDDFNLFFAQNFSVITFYFPLYRCSVFLAYMYMQYITILRQLTALMVE